MTATESQKSIVGGEDEVPKSMNSIDKRDKMMSLTQSMSF
jgi:hypothetical protein